MRLLPEPCVCQTMPPRRSNSPSSTRVLPGCQTFDGSLYRSVLLVTADDLDRPPFHRHVQCEVPDDVQQMRGSQHPGDEDLLARQLVDRLAQFGSHRFSGDGLGLLPLCEVLALRGEGSDHRLVEVGRDHELVRVEEALVALVVVDARALVRVALQLVDCLHGRDR